MQKISFLPVKQIISLIAIIILSVNVSRSQSVYVPYSYQLDQKFDSSIYSIRSSFHTSLKPFLVDSLISPVYNAIMQRGVDSSRKTWVARKIFNEHLFDV